MKNSNRKVIIIPQVKNKRRIFDAKKKRNSEKEKSGKT